MSLSLPADPPRSRSLTGVLTQSVAALDGSSEWFAPARSAVVFVVDAAAMHRDGHAFVRSENGVWLTEQVPPRYLQRIAPPPARPAERAAHPRPGAP